MLKVPSYNWIKYGMDHHKFSYGNIPYLYTFLLLITGSMGLMQCREMEADEDGGRQILSYHHFIKSLKIREARSEYHAEADAAKAFELAPWNYDYLFLIDIMSSEILHDNYLDRLHVFDCYMSGHLPDEARFVLEDQLEKHPVVRIALTQEYARKNKTGNPGS